MNEQHPLAIELLAAASYAPGTENIHDHIRGCVSCRADFDLLTEVSDDSDQTADSAAVRRILEGAASLPTALINNDNPAAHGEPVPGELWRIGNADEAVLALVSHVIGDAAIVIPMILDVDMADESSVYVDADASPLGVDAILLYDMARTVPLSTFLTLLGPLDVPDDIAEDSERLIGAAVIGDNLAFPIENSHDLRIEPRLEIEELLDALTASDANSHTVVDWGYEYAFERLREDLGNRVFGSDLHPLPRTVFEIGQFRELTCLAKVTHLQTSTVIAALSGNQPHMAFTVDTLAGPCRELLRHEPDSHAVAVVIPVGEWVTALFTGADTHGAFAAPTGAYVGPTTTLIGYGLLDTMHKYLDGRVTAWEETETTPTRLNTSDIRDVVRRHATEAVQRIRKSGSRSQATKRIAWTDLPTAMDESVARFVQALLDSTPVNEALRDLKSADDR
jgi:hypothetical protein